MLAQALITQAIALARSCRSEHAQFCSVYFQKAIEVARRVNALNTAGLAALTLIEEVDQLPPATSQATYQQAREWLANSESQDVLQRLNEAAGKFARSLRGELSMDDGASTLARHTTTSLPEGSSLYSKVEQTLLAYKTNDRKDDRHY